MVLQIKLLLDQETRKKKTWQVFSNIPENGYFMDSPLFFIFVLKILHYIFIC